MSQEKSEQEQTPLPTYESVVQDQGFDPEPTMQRDLSWRALAREQWQPGNGTRRR